MASTNGVEEKILDRIRRVSALTNSPNEHEAAAAAAKLQELLFKYNLELTDVQKADDADSQFGLSPYEFDAQGRWRTELLMAIADNNFVKVVRYTAYVGAKGARFGLVGRRHNIEVVAYFFETLSREVEKFAAANATGKGASYAASYKRGIVRTIRFRLQDQFADNSAETAQSTALVTTEMSLVEEKLALFFPHLRSSGRSVGASSSDGWQAGRADGSKVAINPGLSASVGNVTKQLGAG